MPRLFGIEFDRQLQALAVFQYISMFVGYGFLCLFINYYVLFYTRYWGFALLYLVWYFVDQGTVHKGGRQHHTVGKYIGIFAVRKWRVWNYLRDYFPIRLVKTVDLDPARSYIFGCHPHGIFAISAFCAFGTDAAGFPTLFPGLDSHLLTLRCFFFFPFFRELLLLCGLSVASRENIDNLLRGKEESNNGASRPSKAVVLVVGGAREALYARPNAFSLVLSKRFGFVRKALQHGVPLVPCLAFGESDLFMQSVAREGGFGRGIQDSLLKALTFSTPLYWGHGFFRVLPRRRPVTVVVGAPVETGGPTESPSYEQIQSLHVKYVKALVDLFEKHKLEHGLGETDHLEII